MKRVVILGAGFGGLELATMLSSGDDGGVFDVTLIDRAMRSSSATRSST